MNPLVSVIVPVYKVEQYLDECVESIVGQTYKNLEVILVDDGSPDRCGEMCDSWAKKDSRIKIVHRKNGGLSAARNSGQVVATGEWILFVDSDDKLISNAVSLLISKSEETYADLVMGNVVIEDNNLLPMKFDKTLTILEGTTDIFNGYIHHTWNHTAWNKLVRRSILEENNVLMPEGMINEDEVWSFELACIVRKMAFVQEETYYYRSRPESIMATRTLEQAFESHKSILCRNVQVAKKYGITKCVFFQTWFDRFTVIFFNSLPPEKQFEWYWEIRKNTSFRKLDEAHLYQWIFPWQFGFLVYRRLRGHLCC